jgi:hypothetical protein
VGLGFRSAAVYEGLPYDYHWDEPLVLHHGLDLIRTQTFIPDYWLYPHLYIYLQSGFASLAYIQAMTEGEINFPSKIDTYKTTGYAWEVENYRFLKNGRFFTVLWGVAFLIQVGVIARLCVGRVGALVAVAICALNPILINHSARISTDIPGAVFCLWIIIHVLKTLRNHELRWWDFFIPGVLGGLATATKYTYYPVLLVPILGLLLHPYNLKLLDVRLLLLPIGAATSFIAVMPGSIIEIQQFLYHIGYQYGRLTTEGIQASELSSVPKRIAASVKPMVISIDRLLITLIAASSFVFVTLKYKLFNVYQQRSMIIVALFGLYQWSSLWKFWIFFDRYLTLVLPLIIAVPAAALYSLVRRSSPPKLVLIANVILGLFILLAIINSGRFVNQKLQTDPRVLAAEWINENLPENGRIAVASELFFYKHAFREDIEVVEANKISLPFILAQETDIEYALLPEAIELHNKQVTNTFKGSLEHLNRPFGEILNAELIEFWDGRPTRLDAPSVLPEVELYSFNSGQERKVSRVVNFSPRLNYLTLEAFNETAMRSISSMPGLILKSHGRARFPVRLPQDVTKVTFNARADSRAGAWPNVMVILQAPDGKTKFQTEAVSVKTAAKGGNNFTASLKAPKGDYECIIGYFSNTRENKSVRPPLYINWLKFE